MLINAKRAMVHLSRVDPVMADLIARVGPITLKPRRQAPLECLVQEITNQQLSRKAADTIFKNFLGLFGSRFPAPETLLEKEVEALRAAGLSRAKAQFIRGVAGHVINGRIPTLEMFDKLTDAEIAEVFKGVKGVGRWTIEMLLIFNLGRPDVLPVHDAALRRGFQIAYKKRLPPKPELLEKFGRKWKPYRTTASWYLWRSLDLE
jgi:DNA-3-methyladenine glycosylase II